MDHARIGPTTRISARIVLLLIMGVLGMQASSASATASATLGNVLGVTVGGRLISFDAQRPGTLKSDVRVTNLKAGEKLLGIDVRPATGQLYGLGSTSQIYTIDPRSGAATPVGAAFQPPLEGREFGFDFNPVVDRIRIVSGTGQNLRVNPDTGQVQNVDGRLAFAAGDANAKRTPEIVGAAYTNPDTDPNTTTVLYGIDERLDGLVTQDPPNDGVLNTVGGLKAGTTALVGFDIGSLSGDQTSTALASLQPDSGKPSRLYIVDLGTGRGTDRGRIGGTEQVRDITIVLGMNR